MKAINVTYVFVMCFLLFPYSIKLFLDVVVILINRSSLFFAG